MTKLMLVEDDKSLREIYGVRLNAEGYQIISAGDGEEALAMAVKEKPDLILADVMMPKISGFDMLDILRSTPETKDVKVIMMTALSSEDQRARGEALGANRYLVKSQVGIEDVVRTIHDVLADTPIAATSGNTAPAPAGPGASAAPQATAVTPPANTPAPAPTPVSTPTPPPVQPAAPAVVTTVTPAPQPPKPIAPTTPVMPPKVGQDVKPATANVTESPAVAPAALNQNATTIPVSTPAPQPTPPVAPVTPPTPQPPKPVDTQLPQPTAPFSTPAPASLGEKVINPISPDITEKHDISAMMDQELNNGSQTPPSTPPTIPPAAPAT